MLGPELEVLTQKRDFGVIIDSSPKTSAQYAAMTLDANKMLDIFKNGI